MGVKAEMPAEATAKTTREVARHLVATNPPVPPPRRLDPFPRPLSPPLGLGDTARSRTYGIHLRIAGARRGVSIGSTPRQRVKVDVG